MFRLDLNGRWTLACCEPGEGEVKGWPADGPTRVRTVEAAVPGDVHVDLIEAGLIDEPLYGQNAPDCRWVEEKDWWYARTFDLPADAVGGRVELHFEGLDCTADVWLNGAHLGRTNNANIPHTLDATAAARAGLNRLVVRVDTGTRAAAGKELLPYSMHGAEEPRVWMRKAQFTYGWDWASRLATCGIWRRVELRAFQAAALRDVCLRTHLEGDGSARVEVLAEVENLSGAALSVQVEVTLSRGAAYTTLLKGKIAPGVHTLSGELAIPEPDLWWPAPLGGQPLYDVTAVLSARRRELDRRAFRHGLREVALLQEPLEGDEGTSFVIAVNGQKVFCKGANWVPADSILARVTPARYSALVGAAAEANFNMFRVWGGGVFEDDAFYQLCDEHGILIWHDFLYACAYYPDEDEEFVAEARREAEAALRRLRNYASIALWCGNNENQWIHYQRRQGGAATGRCVGERLYDEVLPEVCARMDPTRPYWPGSPYGGEDPNSEFEGDRHGWFVSIQAPTLEERIDYRLYARDRAKFMSEFGILAPPPLESARRYLPPDQIQRGSPAWETHNNRFEKGTNQEALKRYWRPAEELPLEQYVRVSQMIQAEALKFALEHWRRRKFLTAGALFWMYADCWGEVGWTIIDYYLRRKPSYYAVKRALAHLLVSFQQEGDQMGVWLVNDRLDALAGELTTGWVNLRTGEVVSDAVECEAPANAAAEVARMDMPDGDRTGWMAFGRFESEGRLLSYNRHFLAGFQFNALRLPDAIVTVEPVEEGSAVEVRTTDFAWQVHLEFPRGVWLEDNDFDMLPGEVRRIRAAGPPDLLARTTAHALNAQVAPS
jgi:beta-mannosidase